MVEELKVLLGAAAANFTDEQIVVCFDLACSEVEAICDRPLNHNLKMIALEIAKIKLNRLGTEGLVSEGFAGVSQSYLDGYPQEIQDAIKRNRRIRVV